MGSKVSYFFLLSILVLFNLISFCWQKMFPCIADSHGMGREEKPTDNLGRHIYRYQGIRKRRMENRGSGETRWQAGYNSCLRNR